MQFLHYRDQWYEHDWTIDVYTPGAVHVGFLKYRTTGANPRYATEEMIWMHNLEVPKYWQHRRLGTALLHELLRLRPKCQVIQGIFLHTAVGFWRRMGKLYLRDALLILDGDHEYLELNRRRIKRLLVRKQ
jgi:hypothetical protein